MTAAATVRARRLAYWSLPLAACLALYWQGLACWFQADDFAWLASGAHISHARELVRAMLEPSRQGTLRPWSDRAFFMIFYAWFGLDALPFRICVFLTQFANILLLLSIARRLTGSRAIAFLAALLWIVNASLAQVMTWTAAYNEALGGLFMLAAFSLLLRFIETGRRRYWTLQWIVFVLGFGAIELNVVYPALAAVYTFLCARKHLTRTLALFIPSIAFAVADRALAPPAVSVYQMHFGWSMIKMLRLYWSWTLGPAWLHAYFGFPVWLAGAATWILTLGLAGAAMAGMRRGNFLPVFFLAWFAILIAPFTPLRDHQVAYYPFLASIGVAMLGACAVVEAWQNRAAWKILAVSLAAIYLAASVAAARHSTLEMYGRSQRVENLVLGVARAHELHPRETILLDGVSSELFWIAILHHPFALVGAPEVYLTPGSEARIDFHPELGNPAEFIMRPATLWRLLRDQEAVVYSARQPRLRNITETYAGSFPQEWK